MRRHPAARFAGAGLLTGLLGACYAYAPVAVTPQPDARVAVILSDVGRVGASNQIGSQAARVEGSMVASSDTGYLLAVSGVKPISGAWVRWTGETVSLRRDDVALLQERRLSKSRTVLFVAGVTAAVATAVFGFDLFGIGNDRVDTVPNPGGDPGDQ